MADIRPFRAYFYQDSLRKKLSRLVCPPYDVISKAQQNKLLKKNGLNFVRVELPSGSSSAKYGKAAKLWRKWLAQGVIRRDVRPAIYVYEAAFRSQADGRQLVRRGFFAALRVVPWGRGVFPHEKTLPTPKKDRFRLFKAVRVQTSPIQCLFRDSSGKAAKILRRLVRGKAWVDFRDGDGVRHRVWRADGSSAAPLQKILRRAPVVIADGHHRYETARAYSAWARGRQGGESANHVMTYFSPSSDPGLEVLPTHRAVGKDKKRFVRLEEWGEESTMGLKNLLSRLNEKMAPFRLECGTFHDGRSFLYRLRAIPSSVRKTPLAELAVACLHAGPLNGLGKEDFFFSRSPAEALAAARRGRGWAFFLSPSTVDQVIKVAVAGHVMPPKSTYFYPKIPSGFLSHSLQGKL